MRSYVTGEYRAENSSGYNGRRALILKSVKPVQQRRRNHPGHFPFSVVSPFDTNHAANLILYDFILFAARDKKGEDFAQKRLVADDYQVAVGLFKRFSRRGNLVFWAKTFAL